MSSMPAVDSEAKVLSEVEQSSNGKVGVGAATVKAKFGSIRKIGKGSMLTLF